MLSTLPNLSFGARIPFTIMLSPQLLDRANKWQHAKTIPSSSQMVMLLPVKGSFLNALAGSFSEDTRQKCKGWNLMIHRNFIWRNVIGLRVVTWPRVVWLPNESNYSHVANLWCQILLFPAIANAPEVHPCSLPSLSNRDLLTTK